MKPYDVAKIIKQPVMGYNFEVRLPADMPNSYEVSRLVVSASLPGLNIETEDQLHLTPVIPASMAVGIQTGSQFSLTFVENECLMVTKYFNAWLGMIINEDGELAPPAEYWRDIVILLLDSTGDSVSTYRYTYTFPINFYTFELDYGQNNYLGVQVNFKYSSVEFGSSR